MEIAVLLNIHQYNDLVKDTLDAVEKLVSNKILIIVDGYFWNEEMKLPFHSMKGVIHNYYKSPYRNIALGLSKITEVFPKADWYCYLESDVLFTSEGFKQDLEKMHDFWCIGNNGRTEKYELPFLEYLIGRKIEYINYLLGCCLFFNKDFIYKLQEIDFFNKFLFSTNQFVNGFFPGYKGYDLSEHLYPTLAYNLGGKVGSFSRWSSKSQAWDGDYKKYLMRWLPDIETAYAETSIIHPLKDVNSYLRKYYKVKRNNV